jgi:hypothetical protein
MTEENNNVRELHPAQPEQPEVPRAGWFERLILTVDCCRPKGEAEALGDEATPCAAATRRSNSWRPRSSGPARPSGRASKRAPTYQGRGILL